MLLKGSVRNRFISRLIYLQLYYIEGLQKMKRFSGEKARLFNDSTLPNENNSTFKEVTKSDGPSTYEFYRAQGNTTVSNFNEDSKRLLGAKDQEGGHFSNHPISASSYSAQDNGEFLVNQSTVRLLTEKSQTEIVQQNTSLLGTDDKLGHFGGSFAEDRNFSIGYNSTVTSPDDRNQFNATNTMGWNAPYKNNDKNTNYWNNFSQEASLLSSTDSNSSGSNFFNSDNTSVTANVSSAILPERNTNNLEYYYLNNISFVGLFPSENSNGNLSLCDLNFTLCYGNYTGNVTVQPDTGGSDVHQSYWKLFLMIFPFLTVFGNILVCLSVYKEKSLRTVTNYFIVSLAVADIMVAVFVMPLAVYVEVNLGAWTIGNILCDTYVALDVMCCTASILNLTAISVDRFIAVTRPISYAKHKGSNRVYVMLALVWLVSIGISSPIALGMNYTDKRKETLCIFYNSDFIIYSSMGSFYIPCVIMMFLYWRIFKAIRDRAKKSVAKRPKNMDHNSYKNVIENKAQTTRTSSENSNTEENGNGNGNGYGTVQNKQDKREMTQVTELPTSAFLKKPNLSHNKQPGNSIETSFTNYNAKFSGTDTDNENNQQCFCQIEAVKSPTSEDTENDHVPDHIIANQKLLLSPTSEEDNKSESNVPREDDHSGYSAPSCVEVDVGNKVLSPTYSNKALLSPLPHRKTFGLYKEYKPNSNKKKKSPTKKIEQHQNGTPKKYVTKFNFHLRHSKKKKDQKRSTSSKRERKATKTLAIVLGVFLLCWVPFFTINIMNAICIRYDLFDTRPECNINDNLFSLFVWLGYINSFLNPVIYTIFNIEFRKAFKKLLKHPCK